ncbi:putative codeinone reductase (NADPH) [Helianthus annuus]|nr:putative codeinone reductase (NADPH) [Helianthus annuus]
MVITIPEMMITSSEGPRPVPVIAMGTAVESVITGIEVVTPSTLIEAIKVGYRHFDTAAVYQTEKSVGEAIAEALQSGLIKSRLGLFITTKLWCNSCDRHLVVPAIKQSLKNLGLEYVDLYLIHWPLKLNIQDDFKGNVPSEGIAAIDMKAVWEGMEECQTLGLTKSIGVSNFSSKRIEQILSFAKIPPAVNQVIFPHVY